MESVLLVRSLLEDLPQPYLPDGFYIRLLNEANELEDYVALHRAAFGSDQMTLEFRRSIMGSLNYNPELDLVLTSSDKRLVGFCHCQIFR